jgi:Spy/CpxP family protein refolding chaperone
MEPMNMKSIRNILTATLLTAGAVLTAATGMSVASAADDTATTATPPPGGPHGWHHHGGEWHFLKQLGLTPTQTQQIKDIFAAARPEMQSLHEQMHANMQKLQQTKPTDANYTTISSQVSQTHGSLSAEMLTQHAALRAQVFKVLTGPQQTQLAALEAQAQAAHKHGPAGAPPSP